MFLSINLKEPEDNKRKEKRMMKENGSEAWAAAAAFPCQLELPDRQNHNSLPVLREAKSASKTTLNYEPLASNMDLGQQRQSLPNLDGTMEGLLKRLTSETTTDDQVSGGSSRLSNSVPYFEQEGFPEQPRESNGQNPEIQSDRVPTEKQALVTEIKTTKDNYSDEGIHRGVTNFSGSSESPLRRGCLWIYNDMMKKHLYWVKIVLFLQSAGMVSLYPYLAIHMRSLGFSVEDTALVNLAIPVADIFGPPVAGIIADKIGNFKIFCALITVLSGASSLLLMAIPDLSEEVVMQVCCDQNNSCYYNHSDIVKHAVTTKVLNGTVMSIDALNSTMNVENLFCSAAACTIASNWTRSFWSYLTVRVILDLLRSSCLSISESAIMAIVQQEGGDYGLQKLFGTAGSVIFGPLAGLIIDASSSVEENYNVVFYLYFGLRFLSAMAILQLSLTFKKKSKNVFSNTGKVLCQVEVMLFLIAFLMAGILWGFLETFLFWYLEDLGSTKFLMGWTLAVGTILGVPLTIFSKLIMRKFGHTMILWFALMFYTIRLLGYSYIQKPEYSILFEAMKPFCTTIVFVSAFTMAKDNSPLETVASVNSIFGALYFGVGRGLGGLLSGFSIEAFGAVMTFRYFAAASFLSGNIYMTTVMYYRFRTRTRAQNQIPIVIDESNEKGNGIN